MENKEDSNNLNQSKITHNREKGNSDLGLELKQNINFIQNEYIGQSGNAVGVSDQSAKNTLKTQICDENEGSKSGERQSLVFNLKDKGGISVNDKDNSKILLSLREGVGDLAKAYAIKENNEENEELPDTHLGSRFSTKGEDNESRCGNHSAEGVRIHGSESSLPPASIKVIEGCKSCSHIYKGSSKMSISNSQTQTSHINRTAVTDIKTSTNRTCSSQTVVMEQRNNIAQTACSQATQECQTTPIYTTTSCQTSIPKSNNIQKIIIKPWSARKYNDMCMCAELGTPCTCANRNTSSWEMLLPRNSSWWPTVKKTLLIIAAIIPWVLLVVYAVYYYRIKAN